MEVETGVENSSSITIFIFVLLSLLAVFAVLGNGVVLGVIARFRRLRTFPNILMANLVLADFFSALINVPMYLLWGVLNVKWFTGKNLAIISLFLNRLFILLNLASMSVLLLNVFLAIKLDLKYFTWKTKKRALTIVLLEWLVSVVGAVLLSGFHSDIDLQGVSVARYRLAILAKAKHLLTAIITGFIFIAMILSVLAFCSIQRKKRKRKRLNLPQLQDEARLQLDIRAAKTVAITVLAFFLCYIPPACIGALVRPKSDAIAIAWPGHTAFFSMFLSSGINPVIYCFRARRIRRAVKQLLNDPCGKTAFQENNQEQRIKQNVIHKNEGDATEGNEFPMNEFDEARREPAACSPFFRLVCNSSRCSRGWDVTVPSCGKEKKGENTDGKSGSRASNRVMPYSTQEPHSQEITRLAWVETHPTGFLGTNSIEDRH